MGFCIVWSLSLPRMQWAASWTRSSHQFRQASPFSAPPCESCIALIFRSVTMDTWTEEQLRKMEAGGNTKLNVFFKQYGVEKACPSRKKYNSPAAEVQFEFGMYGRGGRALCSSIGRKSRLKRQGERTVRRRHLLSRTPQLSRLRMTSTTGMLGTRPLLKLEQT